MNKKRRKIKRNVVIIHPSAPSVVLSLLFQYIFCRMDNRRKNFLFDKMFVLLENRADEGVGIIELLKCVGAGDNNCPTLKCCDRDFFTIAP